MILIFGDSHTAVFTIQDNTNFMTPTAKLIKNNQFCSFKTYPYTCFNINNKTKIIYNDLNSINIQKKDIVFFSYGETDIRCHIGYKNMNQNEDEIIIKVVDNYMNFLINIRNTFNFNVGCYGPIASGIYNGINGNNRPSFNNSIERNRITLKFNNILKEACNKNDIIYKDIFRHLINEQLETKSELYCDGIHLGIGAQPILLEEFSDIIQNYTN